MIMMSCAFGGGDGDIACVVRGIGLFCGDYPAHIRICLSMNRKRS